jgi:hypothetical protein
MGKFAFGGETGKEKPLIRFCVLGLALGFLVGCQKQEEIQKYKAAKPDFGEAGKYRILVAIAPDREVTWFFKMKGQVEWVYQHKEDFKSFVDSLRFPAGARLPRWNLPAGWQIGDPKPGREKTFLIGSKDKGVELAVTQLPLPLGQGGNTLLANVNRWREDLGLKPIPENEIKNFCKEWKVQDRQLLVVELTGPGRTLNSLIDYKLPGGWEATNAFNPELLAFRVVDKEQMARVSITLAGGSLTDNVNRWRGQVGLPPLTEEEIKKDIKVLNVDDRPAQYVDISGKEIQPGRGDRILGAIQSKERLTMFYKMMGPADLVGREQENFEAFLRSIRFHLPKED